MERKTIATDLDGIIVEYDGWKGPEHFGKLQEGVKERLRRLSRDHDLILFSCRMANTEAAAHVYNFLEREGILNYFKNLTAVKPLADYFLDDKACSSWEELERKLGTTNYDDFNSVK